MTGGEACGGGGGGGITTVELAEGVPVGGEGLDVLTALVVVGVLVGDPLRALGVRTGSL